jgi:hypothetical protein
MATNSQHRKRWGLTRWIYFVAGLIAAAAAAFAFLRPGGASLSPILLAVVAVFALGVPVLASDALLHRVHRIFWHSEWPR